MKLPSGTMTIGVRLNAALLSACLAIAIVLNPATVFSHSSIETSPQTSANPAIAEAVQRNFGKGVEVVTSFNPFQVTGDFNGDRLQDLVVVVRITGPLDLLPNQVRLLNPFERGGSLHFPRPSDSRLALAILHDWKNPAATGRFLLLGESPILILQNARAISNQETDRNGLLGVRSRSSKRRAAEPFPRTAKGDIVLLGTEVGGDSLLYWNGRTYLWEDSAED